MNLRGKRVLVTGAGGFIGSHLVERLVSDGASVRAFVRYTSKSEIGLLSFTRSDVLRKVEIFRGDLRDTEAVFDAIRDREFVFHLGAVISVPYSYVHPRETVETNVIGTLNVLMAAKRSAGVRRVVQTSSSEVYGTARRSKIDESHPLQAQSPYAASKTGADKLAESFHRSYGTPVVVLRPFNTYGPRQSARAVIPTIITQALRGGEVALGNLSPTRDLTYVDDTVDGFIQAALARGVDGMTLNLGTSRTWSVGDLVRRVERILGRRLAVRVIARRKRPESSEVERLISDYSEAKRLLRWRPRVSLDQGLRSTVEWIRKNLDHYTSRQYEI